MPNEKKEEQKPNQADFVSATPQSKNYPDDEWTNVPEETLSQEERERRDKTRAERSQKEQEAKEPKDPAKLRAQQRP